MCFTGIFRFDFRNINPCSNYQGTCHSRPGDGFVQPEVGQWGGEDRRQKQKDVGFGNLYCLLGFLVQPVGNDAGKDYHVKDTQVGR